MNIQVQGPELTAQINRAKIAKQRIYGTQRVRNMAQVFKLEALAREQHEREERELLLKQAARKKAKELQRQWLIYLRTEVKRLRIEEQKKRDALKFISMPRLIGVCCRVLGVGAEDIKGPRRFGDLVQNRQIICWVGRNIAKKSYPEIGRGLNRDHSSVLHGVKMVDAKREQGDRKLEMKIEQIRRQL